LSLSLLSLFRNSGFLKHNPVICSGASHRFGSSNILVE
jgi:hypothetical protein